MFSFANVVAIFPFGKKAIVPSPLYLFQIPLAVNHLDKGLQVFVGLILKRRRKIRWGGALIIN